MKGKKLSLLLLFISFNPASCAFRCGYHELYKEAKVRPQIDLKLLGKYKSID